MKTKILILIIISITIISCNSLEKDKSIINKSNKKYLLYLNKTDSDTLKPVINDTIKYNKFIIPYKDKIHKIYSNIYKGIIEEQIITNRTYYFGTDTVSVAFTNYCTDWCELDSLNSVFIFPNGSLGLIAVNTYSPGTVGACGGSYFNNIEIYSFNNSKLKLITRIFFDGCLGELIIDDKNYGKEQYIDKVYWSKNGKRLIFDTGEDLLYQFNINTKTWEN